jgi:DNA-binding transcriptional MocR family regulator
MNALKTEIGPWALVPLWVTAKASPVALKLYALLAAKWADRESHSCFPAKRSIAQSLGTSESTVERALRELVGIGAIEVRPRFRVDGGPTSNLYVLKQSPPAVPSPVTPGRPIDRPRTTTNNQSQSDCDPSDRVAPPRRSRRRATLTTPRAATHLARLAASMGVDDPDMLVSRSPWRSEPLVAANEMVRAWRSSHVEDKKAWCATFLRTGPKDARREKTSGASSDGPADG